MLILAIILFGMLVGAAAQLILGRGGAGINWPLAFASGLIGSFVGGLLASLIAGDGLDLQAQRHHRLDRRRDPGDRRLAVVAGTLGAHLRLTTRRTADEHYPRRARSSRLGG